MKIYQMYLWIKFVCLSVSRAALIPFSSKNIYFFCLFFVLCLGMMSDPHKGDYWLYPYPLTLKRPLAILKFLQVLACKMGYKVALLLVCHPASQSASHPTAYLRKGNISVATDRVVNQMCTRHFNTVSNQWSKNLLGAVFVMLNKIQMTYFFLHAKILSSSFVF